MPRRRISVLKRSMEFHRRFKPIGLADIIEPAEPPAPPAAEPAAPPAQPERQVSANDQLRMTRAARRLLAAAGVSVPPELLLLEVAQALLQPASDTSQRVLQPWISRANKAVAAKSTISPSPTLRPVLVQVGNYQLYVQA